MVNELERNLKIDDKILKFMTVLKAETVDSRGPGERDRGRPAEGRKEGGPVPAAPEANPAAAAAETDAASAADAQPSVPEETDAKGGKRIMIRQHLHPGAQQRPKTAEEVLSSKKILPFLYGFEYKDRVQRLPDAAGFHDGRGKIMPRRITGNCAKHQRELTVAIKRARTIALLPFVVSEG